MINTRKLAEICGVSLKTITVWASNNGVKKRGYRWDFSSDDCRKLFLDYQVEENEASLTLQMKPLTENEPSDESFEPSNEPKNSFPSTSSIQNEENEPSDESIIEVLSTTIQTLKTQLGVKDAQLEAKDLQIQSLLETNQELSSSLKALSAANSVQIAADKRDLLLTDINQEQKRKKRKSFLSKLFGE